MLKYLVPFTIAALVSLVLTPLARRLAFRIGAVDLPGDRKVHKQPVPRIGGLAVFGAVLITALSLFFGDLWREFFGAELRSAQWFYALVGGVLIVSVGALDDIRPLGLKIKLAAEVVVALMLIAAGFTIASVRVPFLDQVLVLGYFSVPFTVLWFVGITNALNLIDGLDGLASGVALIACLTITAIGIMTGHVAEAMLSVILAGAVLGFLRYNFHPASIFLGDSGSLFLGFALAALSISGSLKGATVLTILVPMLALGLPIFDTLLTVLRRVIRGIGERRLGNGTKVLSAVFLPDKDHIHHRLLKMGLRHQHAVLVLYAVCFALAAVSLASVVLQDVNTGLLVAAVALATFVGVGKLGYRELALFKSGTLLSLYDLPVVDRQIFHVFFDMALVSASYVAALFLTFEWISYGHVRELLVTSGPAVVFVHAIVFYALRLYKRAWRYGGPRDALLVAGAVSLGVLASAFAVSLSCPGLLPWRTFVVLFLAEMVLCQGLRFSFRILEDLKTREPETGRKTIIYGAGGRGAQALRELLQNEALGLIPVGFVDDDKRKRGQYVKGYPVLGSGDQLVELAEREGIEEIVGAIPSFPEERQERLRQIAKELGIRASLFEVRLRELDGDGAAKTGDGAGHPGP